MASKAVLLDIRSYLADNNIRRSASSFSVNYGSTSENLLLQTLTLEPNETKLHTTPMNPSVVTLLRTNSLVTVTVTPRVGAAFTVDVTRLLILDEDLASLSIHSPSSTADITSISLLQG